VLHLAPRQTDFAVTIEFFTSDAERAVEWLMQSARPRLFKNKGEDPLLSLRSCDIYDMVMDEHKVVVHLGHSTQDLILTQDQLHLAVAAGHAQNEWPVRITTRIAPRLWHTLDVRPRFDYVTYLPVDGCYFLLPIIDDRPGNIMRDERQAQDLQMILRTVAFFDELDTRHPSSQAQLPLPKVEALKQVPQEDSGEPVSLVG
jgi:hypothetical protein